MTTRFPARYPAYLPFPSGEISNRKNMTPNASSVNWPQAQFAPKFLPPGWPSFQPFRFPDGKIQRDAPLFTRKVTMVPLKKKKCNCGGPCCSGARKFQPLGGDYGCGCGGGKMSYGDPTFSQSESNDVNLQKDMIPALLRGAAVTGLGILMVLGIRRGFGY